MGDRFVFLNEHQMSEAAANHILDRLRERVDGHLYATLAISGGKSPREMFSVMATAEFPWQRLHLFWVDERAVPPGDPLSNYRMAHETLIEPAGIPLENVHRVRAELPPEEAAREYAEDLRRFFALKSGELPQFDVVHRGVGAEGHTASLFPGEPLIQDRENLAAAVWVEKVQQWRITLLPGVLRAARETVMFVGGDDKAEALQEVLNGPYDPMQYPAQIGVRDGAKVTWFLDQGAARLIGQA